MPDKLHVSCRRCRSKKGYYLLEQRFSRDLLRFLAFGWVAMGCSLQWAPGLSELIRLTRPSCPSWPPKMRALTCCIACVLSQPGSYITRSAEIVEASFPFADKANRRLRLLLLLQPFCLLPPCLSKNLSLQETRHDLCHRLTWHVSFACLWANQPTFEVGDLSRNTPRYHSQQPALVLFRLAVVCFDRYLRRLSERWILGHPQLHLLLRCSA